MCTIFFEMNLAKSKTSNCLLNLHLEHNFKLAVIHIESIIVNGILSASFLEIILLHWFWKPGQVYL